VDQWLIASCARPSAGRSQRGEMVNRISPLYMKTALVMHRCTLYPVRAGRACVIWRGIVGEGLRSVQTQYSLPAPD